MNRELAEHVSLLAAPIYAVFLARAIASRTDNQIPADVLSALRTHAVDQALALWLDTLEAEA